MRHFFLGALAAQAQHAAFGHQRLQGSRAQLSGFFHQPIHALIGRHAHGQRDRVARRAVLWLVGAYANLHLAAAHLRHRGLKLAALAIEQR